MKLTYNSYLKIDDLLDLQQLKSSPPEHDEMLFIIIHQTYELWFNKSCMNLKNSETNLKKDRHGPL